jgi:hypothetical protein
MNINNEITNINLTVKTKAVDVKVLVTRVLKKLKCNKLNRMKNNLNKLPSR